jgi:hypothetical protein
MISKDKIKDVILYFQNYTETVTVSPRPRQRSHIEASQSVYWQDVQMGGIDRVIPFGMNFCIKSRFLLHISQNSRNFAFFK